MKKCNKCLVEKSLNEFFADKRHSTGRYSICKQCKTESTYLWRTKERVKYNAGARAWRKKNRHWVRVYGIKRRFGLSKEEYYAKFESQNNCCAICGTSQSNLKKVLSIDHCHTTGTIRDLLCSSCNKGLGNFKESESILTKAIAYLEKHRLKPGKRKIPSFSPWSKTRK